MSLTVTKCQYSTVLFRSTLTIAPVTGLCT
jgi:hypothetical protein